MLNLTKQEPIYNFFSSKKNKYEKNKKLALHAFAFCYIASALTLGISLSYYIHPKNLELALVNKNLQKNEQVLANSVITNRQEYQLYKKLYQEQYNQLLGNEKKIFYYKNFINKTHNSNDIDSAQGRISVLEAEAKNITNIMYYLKVKELGLSNKYTIEKPATIQTK